MIKVTTKTETPVPPAPPITFPFLYRSPEYPDRIYLRMASANPSSSRSTDVRLTSDCSAKSGILTATFTDDEAWAKRLTEDEVVTLRNDFGGPTRYSKDSR